MTKPRPPRRGRKFWEQAIKEFEGSDETQTSFADRKGVSVSSLQYWLHKIRLERDSGERGAVRFVELKADETTRARHEMALEVEFPSGAKMRLSVGSDPAMVSEIVSSVASRL